MSLTPRIQRALQYGLAGEEFSNSYQAQTLSMVDINVQMITGQFTTTVGGTVVAGSQVGRGWTVAPGGAAGVYVVSLVSPGPSLETNQLQPPAQQVVSVTAQASTMKSATANADSFFADVSGWTVTPNSTTITMRTCDRTTLAPTGEANAIMNFVVFVYVPSLTPPSLP